MVLWVPTDRICERLWWAEGGSVCTVYLSLFLLTVQCSLLGPRLYQLCTSSLVYHHISISLRVVLTVPIIIVVSLA